MTNDKKAIEYNDSPKVDFSDGWIERELKKRRADPQGVHRRHYTDTRCMGLMIWFAKNNRDVSFALRMRVKVKGATKGERVYDVIGKWTSEAAGLNTKRARSEANTRRSKYELEGFAEVKECPLLEAAITDYEVARRRRDRRTSKRGAGLPDSWGGHVRRFKEIYADFLKRPVNVLDFDTLSKYRNQYVESRMDDIEDEKEMEAELKKVHSCYKTMMPMLKLWFRDTWGWIERDQQVELLTPKGYGKNTRYLYPGEWQASQEALDALDVKCPGAGLFVRFVFATAARPESALLMKWEHLNWGKPQRVRDSEGVEHEALIWLPPPNTMKGRSDDEEGELPCRLVITGESLAILKRLRAMYEARRREKPDSQYTGVFPHKAVQLWANNRSDTQRDIEAQAGTARWNRKVLRHTHATYLQFLGCPQRLITMSLTHTPSEEGAAAVTGVYAGADPVARFMENDELAELALWHLRLHRLIRDMEEGVASPALVAIQERLEVGQKSRVMRERYGVDARFIQVTERAKPKLRIVG